MKIFSLNNQSRKVKTLRLNAFRDTIYSGGDNVNIEQMRQFLIANPQISKDILEGIPISMILGDDMGRVVARTQDKGFSVICEVDDDELTPEERHKKAADLADMAIRMMERMGIQNK